MNASVCVYVDHQDEIGYPVGLVTRDMDWAKKIYLFGSDAKNTGLLEDIRASHPLKDRIVVVTLDQKVEVPGDIATAQNKSIDYLKAHDDSDFFVIVQADTLITKRALPFMEEWFKRENHAGALHLTVRHIRLFVLAHETYFGATLMGRECVDRFVQDGAYMSWNPYWYHEWKCLDIGYFGMAQYYRHLSRNAKTWNVNPEGRAAIEKYHTDRRGFVSDIFRYREKYLLNAPLVVVDREDPIYGDVIRTLGLDAEYEEVKAMIAEGV